MLDKRDEIKIIIDDEKKEREKKKKRKKTKLKKRTINRSDPPMKRKADEKFLHGVWL